MEARRVKFAPRLFAGALLLALSACNSASDEPAKKQKPGSEKAKTSDEAIAAPAEKTIGTPMEERVAILGLLNKRNGETRDLELKPGQYIRTGKVEVRLRACEKTAPWETYPDQGAFVQLMIFERPPGTNKKPLWRKVFSGWLFKENPAANVVQHPIYDIWVKECKMRFPGEETAARPADNSATAKPEVKKPSNAPQSANDAAEEDDEPEEEATPDEQTVESD